MKYKEIMSYFNDHDNYKTKDIDLYAKKLIKKNIDVSDLKKYALKDNRAHRIYFQVNLAYKKTNEEKLKFIEENEDLLNDWWHTDQLLQFLNKPVDFNLIYNCSSKYIYSQKTFTRRWGYVLLLSGPQKDKTKTKDILNLLKDDSEYYVYMAEAWLLCDLAVFNIKEVKRYIKNSKLRYNIIGTAIQKCCDSYRVSNEDKNYLKSLRNKKKKEEN